MKKIILFIIMAVILSFSVHAEQYDVPVCVKFNGDYIDFDNKPILVDGTTYLPVRFFCEALSATVDWEAETRKVTVNHGQNEIIFNIGSQTAYLNGVPKTISGSAILINGVTYLPVRFITESLGAQVSWDQSYYTAVITMNDARLPEELILKRSYSDDEVYWLAKIISSESEDEPMSGKIAVGNVVLNRVESDEFPNTIYSVIYDKKYGYQFQPVANGSINNAPVSDAYLAAKLCLEGTNVVGECLYFLNPDKASSLWIPQNKTYYTTIGDHDFYY